MSIKLAPHDSTEIPSDKPLDASNESYNLVYQRPEMKVQSLNDKSFGRSVTPETTPASTVLAG